MISTTEGSRHGAHLIGILYQSGIYEVINAGQITSVSAGLHPKVKAEFDARRAEVEKRYGVSEK
jgi:hypothetical protein